MPSDPGIRVGHLNPLLVWPAGQPGRGAAAAAFRLRQSVSVTLSMITSPTAARSRSRKRPTAVPYREHYPNIVT